MLKTNIQLDSTVLDVDSSGPEVLMGYEGGCAAAVANDNVRRLNPWYVCTYCFKGVAGNAKVDVLGLSDG